MTKRVVIFDCDVLSYRVAAASEERRIEVTHIKSGRTKVFKNRTAFKDFLKESEFEYIPDNYLIKDIQLPDDVSYALHTLKVQIKGIEDKLWVDDSYFFISGSDNFRESLPLPVKYKSHRADTLKPVNLKKCRQYLIDKYKAKVVNGCETDDALIYKGYELLDKGYEVILVTNDKDANAYSGLSIYNYTSENPEIRKLPDLGYVRLDEDQKKIKGEGLLWYCAQLIIGDATDCFKPTQLSKVKFGDTSAYKALKDCKTEQEALTICANLFKSWYPEEFTYTAWNGKNIQSDWKHMLNLYHQCCRMRETENDALIAYDFFKRHGVLLE
jgi:hypothetical protein